MTCTAANPIVCAIDVTGSMGDFPRVIYDKLPMFYGQIMMQGYLRDPSISFAAIGDIHHDRAPLQVTEFAAGAAIDKEIKKIYIEGGGGAATEDYEFCVYYYTRMVRYEDNETKPFLFITGDETFYKSVEKKYIEALIHPEAKDMTSDEILAEARKKYNIFYLMKGSAAHAVRDWSAVIGAERILKLKDPKAVVDVMLGAIALVSGTRTMEKYMDDLDGRGQTHERKAEVLGALSELSLSLKYEAAMKAAEKPPMEASPTSDPVEAALEADLVRVGSQKSED